MDDKSRAAPLELTPAHVALLERLTAHGFQVVTFPLYANAVGVRRRDCAALLQPVPGGALSLFGDPCYLLDGNLSVQLERGGKKWFVWKEKELEVTPERRSELGRFTNEISELLRKPPDY